MLICLEVALYTYQSLGALEIVLKVLHCEVEILESETIMSFLADEKVSDNEAIVYSPRDITNLENRSNSISNRLDE